MQRNIIFVPVTCSFCQHLFFLVKDSDHKVHYFINNLVSPLNYHLCYFYFQNQFLQSRPLDFFLRNQDWLSFTTKYRWAQETRPPESDNLFVYWQILHEDNSVQSLLIQDNGTAIEYPPGNPSLQIGQLVRRSRLERTKKVTQLSLLKPAIWDESPAQEVQLRLFKLILCCSDERLLDFQVQKLLTEARQKGFLPWSVLPQPIQINSAEKEEQHTREVSFHSDEHTVQWISDKIFPTKVDVRLEHFFLNHSPRAHFLA